MVDSEEAEEKSCDILMQKLGFLRCQIEVTDHLSARAKLLNDAVEKMKKEVAETKGLLAKRDKASVLFRLQGEAEALNAICRYVFSLQPPTSNLN